MCLYALHAKNEPTFTQQKEGGGSEIAKVTTWTTNSLFLQYTVEFEN